MPNRSRRRYSRNTDYESDNKNLLGDENTRMFDNVTERLGHLEADSASTRSDIKSLYNMVERIATQLERMADRSRPNTLGMFGALISVIALVATIGVLAFTPIYRDLDKINTHDAGIDADLNKMRGNRFTSEDGRYLEDKLSSNLSNLHDEQQARIYRNEEVLVNLLQKVSRLEGSVYAPHLNHGE